MDNQFKKMTDFFREMGIENVSHTEKSYLAHAIGVHNDLKKWGCGEDMCRAGVFHSIYGTARFQRVTFPMERRDEIQALIGPRAELLAYWNCMMDRPAFDAVVLQEQGPYVYVNRETGESFEMSEQDFADLMTLHLCDWLEQVPRSREWNYRRAAYRRMAERLGGVALQSYDRVFQNELVAMT